VAISALWACLLNCSAAGEVLNFSICTQKSVYQAVEPITIIMSLENTADLPVTVNKRLRIHHSVYLEIRDKSEKVLQWLPPVPAPLLLSTDFAVIPANQHITVEIQDLRKHLTNDLSAGRYSIKATYSNSTAGKKFGQQAWTGKLESDVISIEITGDNQGRNINQGH
jgi:hypothetical protein